MNRRPLPHTSLPNTATGDKLPNPPIPSCFYYTPWACKEQLQGEKGGCENRQQEVGVKKKKNRLIDSNTMTVGRCTGQTKAGTGNHNLQYQKDMCACHFDVENRGHSEPFSTAFADNCVWQNTSSKRSTDRAQRLVVYHFRSIGNIVRMSKPIVFSAVFRTFKEYSHRWMFMNVIHAHHSVIISAELRSSNQRTMTSVLKPSQRSACCLSRWYTHCYGNQQECEHASGLKG